MKLRIHLVLLLLGGVAPALIFSVLAVTYFVHHEQGEIEHGLTATVRALALAVDGELHATIAVLKVEAASRHLETSDLDMLREEADEILGIHGAWRSISFLDDEGRERLTVTRPPWRPEDVGSDADTVARVLGSGKPVVSDVITGPAAKLSSIVVGVPAHRNGRLIGVLTANVDPDFLQRIVSDQRIRGVATILDRAHAVVAVSGTHFEHLAKRGEIVVNLPRGDAVERTELADVPVYRSVAYAPMSGWSVALAFPVKAVEQPLRRSLTAMGLVAAALTLAAVLLVIRFGRGISASIVSLAAAADAVGHGNRPPALRSVVLEVNAVGHAIENASELLRRRARERDAARAEVEAANRAKDEFMAVLSHELRTPLNAMLSWIHLLRRGALTPDQCPRALEAIERNTRAQGRLIEDLLDVSSIIAGKMRLNLRRAELGRVVEAALDAARPAAEAKGIHVDVRLDPDVPAVTGDPDRLQQVVGNLLSNAVKFTPRGGRIDVRLERAGARARIAVHDTGEGMSAALVPHVFERFRQGQNDRPRPGGLGLGLTIVRHLVELHAGCVVAESAGDGQGSTFTVELPLAAAAETEETAVPAALAEVRDEFPVLTGLHVLLVEDETDGRDPLRIALTRCGATVTAVGCVSEALAALAHAEPDVLVSDITLPDGDGYALLRKVHAAVPPGRVPAVAVTANARLEDRERAFAAGFRAHLAKPVEPAELAQVVAKLGVCPAAPRRCDAATQPSCATTGPCGATACINGSVPAPREVDAA